MNKLLKFTFIILCIYGFYLLLTREIYHPPESEKIANKILGSSSRLIAKKYNLNRFGAGAAMPGGPIKEFSLGFEVIAPLSKEELRNLLINISNDVFQYVSSMPKIDSYMAEPPFTEKNIDILIYNSDNNGREVYYPNVSTARIMKNTLEYISYDPDNSIKVKNRESESRNEALALAKSETEFFGKESISSLPK